jgi:hypothetical protein
MADNSFSTIVGAIVLTLFFIIALPTILFDNIFSSMAFSSFGVLRDMDWEYSLDDGRIKLQVHNDTEHYYDDVAVRFYFYDALGIAITNRRGKSIIYEVDVPPLRPGETKTVTSDPLPDGAFSVELHSSRQSRVRS